MLFLKLTRMLSSSPRPVANPLKVESGLLAGDERNDLQVDRDDTLLRVCKQLR